MVLGRPRFLPAAQEEKKESRISIVIPARDEEISIGNLLESLSRQKLSPLEVVVVDDDSTDGTAEIARSYGAVVLAPASLPDGWKGKPWACQEGARQSKGDWVLFLDADTQLELGAMEKLEALTEQPGRVFSICPHHTVEKPVEGLSAFFNVLMLAGVNAFGSSLGPSGKVGLFGQSLLISRAHYEEVGGHERVRGRVLENFYLATELRNLGHRCECMMGKGSVTMRMFPGGMREMWSSWKKGFTTGAQQAAPRALLLSSIWITGAMLAMCGLLLAVVLSVQMDFRAACAVAYLFYVAQCWWAFRLAGTFSFLNALFFPVSLLFYQILFFTALGERALGVQTEWKGRHVD